MFDPCAKCWIFPLILNKKKEKNMFLSVFLSRVSRSHGRKVSEIVNDSVRSLWVNNRQRRGQIEKHPVLITGRERKKTEEKKGKCFLLEGLKRGLLIIGSGI